MMRIFISIVTIIIILLVALSLYHQIFTFGLVIAGTLALGLILLVLARMSSKAQEAHVKIPDAGANWSAKLYQSLYARYDVGSFVIGMGVVCYALALVDLSSDRGRHASGQWAWLINSFYDWLGPVGPGVLFTILGTFLIYGGIRYKRNQLK